MKTLLFQTGIACATSAVAIESMKNPDFALFTQKCFDSHRSGDWGQLNSEDLMLNDEALKDGGRIFSSYKIPDDLNVSDDSKLWIITERDRSATTLLFPSEY